MFHSIWKIKWRFSHWHCTVTVVRAQMQKPHGSWYTTAKAGWYGLKNKIAIYSTSVTVYLPNTLQNKNEWFWNDKYLILSYLKYSVQSMMLLYGDKPFTNTRQSLNYINSSCPLASLGSVKSCSKKGNTSNVHK